MRNCLLVCYTPVFKDLVLPVVSKQLGIGHMFIGTFKNKLEILTS